MQGGSHTCFLQVKRHNQQDANTLDRNTVKTCADLNKILSLWKTVSLSVSHQHWQRIWAVWCDWSPRLQSPDRGLECKPTSGSRVWGRNGSTPCLRLEVDAVKPVRTHKKTQTRTQCWYQARAQYVGISIIIIILKLFNCVLCWPWQVNS